MAPQHCPIAGQASQSCTPHACRRSQRRRYRPAGVTHLSESESIACSPSFPPDADALRSRRTCPTLCLPLAPLCGRIRIDRRFPSFFSSLCISVLAFSSGALRLSAPSLYDPRVEVDGSCVEGASAAAGISFVMSVLSSATARSRPPRWTVGKRDTVSSSALERSDDTARRPPAVLVTVPVIRTPPENPHAAIPRIESLFINRGTASPRG